jgi:hypothetical protein
VYPVSVDMFSTQRVRLPHEVGLWERKQILDRVGRNGKLGRETLLDRLSYESEMALELNCDETEYKGLHQSSG